MKSKSSFCSSHTFFHTPLTGFQPCKLPCTLALLGATHQQNFDLTCSHLSRVICQEYYLRKCHVPYVFKWNHTCIFVCCTDGRWDWPAPAWRGCMCCSVWDQAHLRRGYEGNSSSSFNSSTSSRQEHGRSCDDGNGTRHSGYTREPLFLTSPFTPMTQSV